MLSLDRVRELQLAVKKIEADGEEALDAVTRLVGEDIAVALLIMHVRRQVGNTEFWPTDAEVAEKTEQFLLDRSIAG
jgi:hypothetical protein